MEQTPNPSLGLETNQAEAINAASLASLTVSELLKLKPEPETLTPSKATEIIMVTRKRVAAGEKLPPEELMYAIQLVPIMRADASTRRKADKKKSPAKKTVTLGQF